MFLLALYQYHYTFREKLVKMLFLIRYLVWNILKRLIKVLFYIVFIASLLSVGLYCLLMQNSRLVNQAHFINAGNAQHSQNLAKRLFNVLQSANDAKEPLRFSFSEKELKALSALSHRAIPSLSSSVDVTPQALTIRLTYEANLPFAKRFINIHFKIFPSLGFFNIKEIAVGHLSMSQAWFLRLFHWGVNTQVKEGLAEKLIDMVNSVSLSHQYVLLSFQLPSDLNTENEDEYALFKELRDKLALFGDVTKVGYYYQEIFTFSKKLSINPSLSRYIAFVFRQAKQQTELLSNTTAVIENRAALTALTLFFGPDNLMLLVGDMKPLTPREISRRRLLQKITTLHKRTDLQKHYIYSIALQLTSNQNASDAIGEMKEFLDSNEGGSGFSFIDLQADRAGTRLALLATNTEKKAFFIQTLMAADFSEVDLIPSLHHLPENINQAEFEEEYRDINSYAYKTILNEIDNRLYQLALYQ